MLRGLFRSFCFSSSIFSPNIFYTSQQSDHILFPHLIPTLPLLQILVVDSEASSLRALNLIEGYTKTVLGQDAPVSLKRLKILH